MPLVYVFGNKKNIKLANSRELLGNKGTGLIEMCRLGIPVPPGFTISTTACKLFYQNGMKVPDTLEHEMTKAVRELEEITGKEFGGGENPLLVSVRSGAPVSMPGMMDTILNVGLNDQTVETLSKTTGNSLFAYDSYRRLIMMFANIVMQVSREKFEEMLKKTKASRGVTADHMLSENDIRNIVLQFKKIYKQETKSEFPQNTMNQLKMARNAVFKSWNNRRAIEYRRMYHIPDHVGTAVTVQTMVFGNQGLDSGTGVGFTRNPSTGENKIYGEYLINSQGEDVVAGVRTPSKIDTLTKSVYNELSKVVYGLEKHYRDIQDFEFTVERGKLYLLQTRSGKRTGRAAIKIACEMVRENLITPKEAVLRIQPEHIEQLLHPSFDPSAKKKHRVIATGLNASPGAASGRIVFDPEEAVQMSKGGERVILVRAETSAEDIHGMAASRGVLTAVGGLTSHAAVVCRQMGKPGIVGCSRLQLDEKTHTLKIGDIKLKKGDYLSIDGTEGKVIMGDVPLAESEIIRVLKGGMKPSRSEIFRYYSTIMSWVDKFRRLNVRANADTPRDADIARKLGAEGIGLCRTEHMFFAEDRLPIMRKLILAHDLKTRQEALNQLLPFQKSDFKGLFTIMKGLAVTIRTIDPPLHEFLPDETETSSPDMIARIRELKEFNPMMGHRGCRLGITMPEITKMQARAIFMAAKEVNGVVPEIMIPIVSHINELENQKQIVDQVAKEQGIKSYKVGTMIEIPRAAIRANELAKLAQFFSFGTNDLTQMTFGFSRDDAGRFLPYYLEKKIFEHDPFATIDQHGVGELMSIATQKGRAARKDIKIGICGEHGGDYHSVKFCHRIGLDYVSCSPYRIPTAKLAAAHAALEADYGPSSA